MAESNYLIDTDVLVDVLRGIPQALEHMEKLMVDSVCYIHTITIAELYAGVKKEKNA